MGLFCLVNAVYPIKEFRQVVVTGMAAVPRRLEIHIYAAVLQLQCQNGRNRQCRVAVNGAMADAEVFGCHSLAVADKIHGIHEFYGFAVGI